MQLRSFCIALGIVFGMQSVSLPALAQAPGQGEIGAETGAMGPRKQLATIVFAGLAGAVLGLSTLSFYGRPQERLQNIAIGAAVGVIVGAGFTTYKAATRPYSYPEVWHLMEQEQFKYSLAQPVWTPEFAFHFEF